jgi:hypothetical protein
MLLVALALLLLLYARDDAPRRAARANHVLVRDRQQVALLHRELLVVHHLGDPLHLLDHLVVALGLLRELGHVHALLAIHGRLHLCLLLLAAVEGEETLP